jgi:hypothetical protein
VHAYLERVGKARTDAEKAAALEACSDAVRPYCAEINLEDLPVQPDQFAPEVAFALDVEAGAARELGRGLGRRYGALRENEIPGTADMCGVAARVAYAGELKSPHVAVPHVERNLQVKAEATAAALTWGKPAAIGELLLLREDGTAHKQRAYWNALDISDHLDEIRGVVRSVRSMRLRFAAGEVLPVTVGDHCKHCDAKPHCPGLTGLVRGVFELPGDYRHPITVANAADAWRRVKVAQKVLGEKGRSVVGIGRIAARRGGGVAELLRGEQSARARSLLAAHVGNGLAGAQLHPMGVRPVVSSVLEPA